MLINRKLWASFESEDLMQYDKEYLPENFCYGGTYENYLIFFCDHNNKILKAPIKSTGKIGKVYLKFKKEIKEELKRQNL